MMEDLKIIRSPPEKCRKFMVSFPAGKTSTRRPYEKNINFNAHCSVIADGLYGGAGGTRPPFRRSNDRAFSAVGRGAGGRAVLLLQ
jgi:hypothetical protein